jgi:hypothetical protein
MPNKRAFVVMGPPSSGTRLMTRILIAGGCDGDGDHVQRWDDELPTGDLIVIRRHQPTGRLPEWAESHGNIITALQAHDYTVIGVIISRDWFCTVRSQILAPHVPNIEIGRQLNMGCWRNIFLNLPDDLDYEIVSYESIMMRPYKVIHQFYDRWNLQPTEPLEPIVDTNEKYYV